MTAQPAARRTGFLTSVQFRATLIVFLCTLLVVGVLSALNISSEWRAAHAALQERLGANAASLAANAASPLRFGATDRGTEMLAAFLERMDGESLGALALDAKGATFAAAQRPDGGAAAGAAELGTLARRALETNSPLFSDDGLSYALPILSSRGEKLGALALRWSAAGVETGAMMRETLAITAATFLAALLAAALVFRATIARPLTRLSAAISEIAARNFATEIPGLRRRDEIGTIAGALTGLRDSLAAGEATNRTALMRGAALSASSTAMMLTDLDHRITDVNGAMVALMQRHAPALRMRHPEFDPEALIGRRADQLLEGGKAAVSELGAHETGQVRFEQDIETGTLVIEINPVHDPAGAKIGFVAEWRDETAGRRNAAILEALDVTQIRAEFRPDGRLVTANPRFCTLFGAEIGALRDTVFDGKLRLRETDRGAAFARVSAGETLAGRFEFETGSGAVALLDGTFGAVRNRSGEVQMLLLMAADVTEQVTALAATETARAQEQQAQRQVVDALRAALSALSEGELVSQIDRPFPTDYETLRQDFNRAKANLREAMRSVLANSSSIRDEAKQITSAADDMSRRTEQQAATLEETASALNELTAAVHSAAENADRANTMVNDAKSKAETSGNVVRDAVLAMGEIEESSNKISKITSVIDEIAFQTNLLALNAGVEAARAGEAGRGFAVVASEVRALAQRSSDAAREIAQLISSSTNQVKRGVGLVGQAGEALAGIQSSVADISVCVSDIAVSTREQSSGLSEINTAVNQLDQVTQRNVAMFEETTAASQSLLREANGLSEAMGQFHIGTDTAAGGTAAEGIARSPAPAPIAGPAKAPQASRQSSTAASQAGATARPAVAPRTAADKGAGHATASGRAGGVPATKPSFVAARATGTALAAPAYDEQDDWEEF